MLSARPDRYESKVSVLLVVSVPLTAGQPQVVTVANANSRTKPQTVGQALGGSR